MADRPLLFLDVDGPLIPFAERPGRSGARTARSGRDEDRPGHPLLHRLEPAAGPNLLSLDCALVRATTLSGAVAGHPPFPAE